MKKITFVLSDKCLSQHWQVINLCAILSASVFRLDFLSLLTCIVIEWYIILLLILFIKRIAETIVIIRKPTTAKLVNYKDKKTKTNGCDGHVTFKETTESDKLDQRKKKIGSSYG